MNAPWYLWAALCCCLSAVLLTWATGPARWRVLRWWVTRKRTFCRRMEFQYRDEARDYAGEERGREAHRLAGDWGDRVDRCESQLAVLEKLEADRD